MKRTTLFFIGLIFICGCSGCLKSPQIYGVQAFVINAVLNNSLQTEVRLKVFNPNAGSAHVSAAQVQLYYRNKIISSSILDSAVSLKGSDTSIVKLQSQIALDNLVAVFPQLITADTAHFRAEGNCKVSMLGINWKIPVKQSLVLKVREILNKLVAENFNSDSGLQIASFGLSKLPGLQTTQFNVVMRAKNHLHFDYRLLGLDLKLYRINGIQPLAAWKMKDTTSVHAGSSTEIPFSVSVDNGSLLSETKISDILHASMNIKVKGTAKVAIGKYVFEIPIEQNKRVAMIP